jgi:hypothetical protein
MMSKAQLERRGVLVWPMNPIKEQLDPVQISSANYAMPINRSVIQLLITERFEICPNSITPRLVGDASLTLASLEC